KSAVRVRGAIRYRTHVVGGGGVHLPALRPVRPEGLFLNALTGCDGLLSCYLSFLSSYGRATRPSILQAYLRARMLMPFFGIFENFSKNLAGALGQNATLYPKSLFSG
ncbi:MAG: hypothetical protein ACYTBJ_25245, partial [Planctomycetota bacterium]